MSVRTAFLYTDAALFRARVLGACLVRWTVWREEVMEVIDAEWRVNFGSFERLDVDAVMRAHQLIDLTVYCKETQAVSGVEVRLFARAIRGGVNSVASRMRSMRPQADPLLEDWLIAERSMERLLEGLKKI